MKIQTGTATMKNNVEILKNMGIELPFYLAIALLDIYPKQTISEKDTCTPVFTAALFTLARTWKKPRCPLADEWIRKLWCGTYTQQNITHL